MAVTLDRNLNVATNTALKDSQVIMAPILYLDFPTLVKYYAGSNNNIILNSSAVMPSGTYIGVGGISAVNTVEETTDLKSATITAEINGLDSTYIALVLAENYYGRDASLGLAALDGNYQVIGEPLLLFKGFMSILSIDMQKETKITVEIESILADWERPRVKRWNSPSQEEIDPADRGFDNVASIVNKEVVWG